jgi:hypothetical protein
MPPKGQRVPKDQIIILEKWINSGMSWEEGFSFGESAYEPPLQPRKVKLPEAIGERTHPIDRILDTALTSAEKAIPENISDAEFMRRVTLDIQGLLPSPDDLNEFLKSSRADKRDDLVEKLLSDDIAYADHWLTMWNDLLRNDYTGTGFITGGRKRITNWLYNSLKQNKPYDQFTRELIAPAEESAGFIDGIKWRGEVNASQSVEIQFAQNISQVFLGINMKCASCHDSFIDRWTLEEAYNLAAIYSDEPLELYRCDKPTGKMAAAKWIFPELGDIDPRASKSQRLASLAELMTHPDNGRFTRTIVNRIWHRLMGRGIVHPVDAMHTRPWNEDLLDYLANYFAEQKYDLRILIKHIMTSQAYQSKCVVLKNDPGSDYTYEGPIAKRMTAEQFMDAVWQITGANPSTMEAKVNRSETAASVSTQVKHIEQNVPLDMEASWIWAYPDTSKVPENEEVELRRTVQIHNPVKEAYIILTADNEYSLNVNDVQIGNDKDWKTVERYDVGKYIEQGTNTITVIARNSGHAPNPAGLYLQMLVHTDSGIRSVNSDDAWEARQKSDVWKQAAIISNQEFLDGRVDAEIRKQLNPDISDKSLTQHYARPVRAALIKNDFLMRSLGRPNRDQVVSTRPAELTTLQAIDLSNGAALSEVIAAGARRLKSRNMDMPELIDWLYLHAVARLPTKDEKDILLDVVSSQNRETVLEDVLWPIFMLPEFQIIR